MAAIPGRGHARTDAAGPVRHHRRPRTAAGGARRSCSTAIRATCITRSTRPPVISNRASPRGCTRETRDGRPVRRSVPDDVPGRRRVRARSARAAPGSDLGGTRRRAAERRFAPRVHGRRPQHLRDLRQPAAGAGVLRRSRRRHRRPSAPPPHEHRRLHARARGRAAEDWRAGLGSSGRLGQPEGSEAGDLRSDRRAGEAARRDERPRAARARRAPSGRPASRSTSTRRC